MNSMSIRHIGVSLVGLLLVAVPAHAQTGMICGLVTDPSGNGREGVLVTLSTPSDSSYTLTPIGTTKTAARGNYTFSSVASGVYTITFALDGFMNVTRPGLRVTDGWASRLDQRLKPSTGEEPTVLAVRPLSPEARVESRGGTFTGDIFATKTPGPISQTCGPVR